MRIYYYRPLVQTGSERPQGALPLAGGICWFTTVELLERNKPSVFVPASRLPDDVLARLTAARKEICGLTFETPRLMGILNVTPDSFSDGGRFNGAAMSLLHAKDMVEAGADIIDVGGESTRPGAVEVPREAEIARTAPVIQALRGILDVPISIDTRKAAVAEAAYDAGANMVNDVSGFTFDSALGPFCASNDLPVFVMHSQGEPETMQNNPIYENVIFDVYDFLEARVDALVAAGIARERIVIDPGIGFGKKIEHNLSLMSNLSIFHGLGCAILLGVSRKGFIRTIGGGEEPSARMPGSVALALAGVSQGVQLLRVHDVFETKQALQLWLAVIKGNLR